MTRPNCRPICHRDGTVTYRSHYAGEVRRRVSWVPGGELEKMTAYQRERVERHMNRKADALRLAWSIAASPEPACRMERVA